MDKIKSFLKRIDFLNRRTILLSWLASYAAVLIIPIIASIFISGHMRNVVREETVAANELKLEILKDKVDEFFFEGERLANEIFYNSDVAKLAEAKTMTGDLRYKARIAGEEMEHHMIASMQSVSGYLYLPESNLVLANGMLIDARQFYDTYYSDSDLSYNKWIQQLKGGQFVYSNNSGYDREGGETMVIENIRPIQMIGKGAEETVILSTAIGSNTLFEGMIDDEKTESIIILDKTGKILLSHGYKYETVFFRDIKLEPGGKAVSFKHNSHKRVASCIDSDWKDMRYVFAVDKDVFNSPVAAVWRISLISLIISILVGAFIIYLIMCRNYKPVKGLIDMLDKVEKQDGGEDEYSMIKRVLESLIARDKSNANILRMNNEALRKVYLLRTVMEKDFAEDAEKKLAEVGIEFKKPCFYVTLMRIESLGSFSDEVFDDQRNRTLAKYAVCNIVNELLNDNGFASYTCETSDSVICVINTDDSTETGEILKEVLTEAQERVGYYLGIMFTMAVSACGRGVKNVHSLYYEAVYAAEYSSTTGGDIIDYAEIDGKTADSVAYSQTKWSELRGFIKLGDIDSVKAALDEIVDEDFGGDAPRMVQKGLACMLVNTVMSLAGSMGILSQELLHDGTECLKELTDDFSVDAMKKGIIDMAEIIGGSVSSGGDGLAFSDDIMKYIEKNYRNFDLNITMIGREFGMTASYLSKMFLNQTGTKLLDYINIYRVEKAKELLSDCPTLTVERIGEMVGFSVNRTFLRTFKKYEGTSPGAYRDSGKTE